MTDNFKLDRHDTSIALELGNTMAMEVAITALLLSHPDREALAKAWADAEDRGFTWTSDPEPGVGDARTRWAQEGYLNTLSRLRKAALSE
ncbi:hypothetical protein EA658_16545 [Pseudoxanthomonas winnipegensis]|uniref:Uncharacterized protein n=1 Tax=Pseudoxanthomonas winnipegensis TaxID=2480810 RepID=A0ABY1WCI6_9GAMM|nr:hypothetical protein [Pseudoxanthomonas winnipegensis]TAA11272.1 hypothetical protein EA659_07960 [Pseudoxanthomonas winnipegensis]TAA18695.1 hypothetical protein EA658_16545 [Pseudoxanthomonas winnipegensis]TAH73929.1 hypothetical protein EA657_00200 [Pseudoxanthomonas winnipegensis]